MIRVVADENIPAIDRALPGEVELRLLAGREIGPDAVRDADALLVRSVTRVNAELLEDSSVRFVASATAGLDHVDTTWLQRKGIPFAWAPGSNAESVAQYVAAALLHIEERQGRALAGRTIGIVGAGQCGSRVERIAKALRMSPRLCDPPLAREGGEKAYFDLSSLADVDFLTLHVPLTASGPDRTVDLISGDFIERMRPGSILINASRGGVVDEAALIRSVDGKHLGGAAIDAWMGEPRIDRGLLSRVWLGTPHIAGYSADGKFRGTAMIAEAFASHFGLEMTWTPECELPATEVELSLEQGDRAALRRLVRRAYPIERDATALASTMAMPPDDAAREFDRLRKAYPIRREFGAYRVMLSEEEAGLAQVLRDLGFSIPA